MIRVLVDERPNFRLLYQANVDASREFHHSVVVPEVRAALADWLRYANEDCVVIGGLAVSHWVRPRATMDIDFLVLDTNFEVRGFSKSRNHAFRHVSTHVDVEVLTPEFIKIPADRAKLVFDTSVELDGKVRVASPHALIVLKLYRYSRQDQADIAELLSNFGEPDQAIWQLTKEELSLL
jgi:hypothetical protein